VQTDTRVRLAAAPSRGYPGLVTPVIAAQDTVDHDLLGEQSARFERDGMLVIEDAVSVETIDRMRAATDRIVAEARQPGRWIGKPVSVKRRVEYRGLFNLDDAFLELLAPPTVFPLVVRLLSPNIHMMSSQLLYAHPNQEPRPYHGGWHRDVIGTSEDLGYDKTPRVAIRVGYYLSDVSEPGSGITLFAPGTHRLKEPIPLPRGGRDPESWVRPKIKPGDAVLWENRTFHAPENNTSAHTRKALMVQYGYRWLRPVDFLDHPLDLLAKCDPVARQLLSSHDLNEDDSMTRMKGSRALKEWASTHGLDSTMDPAAEALEPK
jgi:ectoine hydroxylase-related dioxygenase (phytanoyl-CoA dioxygenase family)